MPYIGMRETMNKTLTQKLADITIKRLRAARQEAKETAHRMASLESGMERRAAQWRDK